MDNKDQGIFYGKFTTAQKRKKSDLNKNLYHLLKNFRRPFFSRRLKMSSLQVSSLFHLPIFFSHFLDFYISNIHKSLHRQILVTFLSSFTQGFLNISRFSPLFSTLALQNLQLQLHNCHLTTANYILQLQKLSSVAR